MGAKGPVLLHVETPVHGRVLISPPADGPSRGLLVGLHGYAENARIQFDRLHQVGASGWLVCSIQALHPFYTRSDGEVVANWMTSLDRQMAIHENRHYVEIVLQRLRTQFAQPTELVLCGFSQGAAMAYRAAVAQPPGTTGVVAVGGDIPPELDSPMLGRLKSTLVARGMRDHHYPAEKMDGDLRRLAEARVPTCTYTFDGGHLWVDTLAPRIRAFLSP